MTSNRVIHASTNIVYVNTAVDSNAVVLFSTATYFAQSVSVRDIGGKAGPSNTISISTIRGVTIPSLTPVKLLKPYDSFTFTAPSAQTWELGNSFAYNTVGLNANIKQPQLSSIVFKDLQGNASIFNVSNTMIQLNRSNIQLAGNETVTIPDPLIQKSIHASTIDVIGSNLISSQPSLFATGYTNTNIYNIHSSYNGSNWNTYPVYFSGGYGTDIKITSNATIFLGFEQAPEYSFGYTNLRLYYTLGYSIQTYIIELIASYTYQTQGGILQYEEDIDGNYLILYNDNTNVDTNSRLYSGSNLITSAPDVFNTGSLSVLNGSTLAVGKKRFVVGTINSIGNILLVIDNIETTTYDGEGATIISGNVVGLENNVDDNLIVNKVQYSKVDDVFLISTNDINTNDFKVFSIDSTSAINTFPTNNLIKDSSITFGFTANAIYINQGTPDEANLPRIVYAGSNQLGTGAFIYYTYSQDIKNQSNFQYISAPLGITDINIRSISLFSNVLYFGNTGNFTSGIFTADSNSFLTSNINVKTSPLQNVYALNSGISLIQNAKYLMDSNVRLSISGTLETNFLTINTQQVSVSSADLYSGNYIMTPVGATIEFAIRNTDTGVLLSLVSYPLYSGTLDNFENGWWSPSYVSLGYYVHGFTVQPGYKLIVNADHNYTGDILCHIINTTQLPIYSNVGTPLNNYSRASYVLSPLNT